MRLKHRTVSMLLITGAALLLTACGGGGGGMTAASNTGTSTAQTCSNCGTALVSLTDAPGDFVNYVVSVVSLQLTRADGTVVQTVPTTTRVDFAQLVNLSEIISANQLPSGKYVSASMTLDYSGASIVVNNGTTGVPIAADNIIDGATGKPLAAPNPMQVTLTLTLDSNNQLFISQGAVANLALDFNLAASNTIAPSDTAPTTVTVNPVLTASLVPDTTKQIRVRGPFVSADTGTSNFIIKICPFFNTSGSNGQLTVGTTATTTYTINGTNDTGSAGLTQLAMLTAGTMIVAYGTWDSSNQSFTASNVLAGSSVPGTDHDSLSGTVVARTGNTLTVNNGFYERMRSADMQPADMGFSRQTMVSLTSSTTVSQQGQSGSFTTADISVGQHVQVMGSFSAPGVSPVTLTASSVQLVPTSVSGSVNTLSSNSVTLSLQSIDGFAASAFNFAGTGMSTAQDASASSYVVMLAQGLTTGALSGNSPAQFIGFVAPFGSAPPDFNATTLVSFANTSAKLWVNWAAAGYAMPFAMMSSTELLISQAALKASNHEVIRFGFETIDPSTLSGGLKLMADSSATSQYFAIGHLTSWQVDNYTNFGDFVAALTTDLGTAQVLQLSARGPYAAGALSADVVEVLLSE